MQVTSKHLSFLLNLTLTYNSCESINLLSLTWVLLSLIHLGSVMHWPHQVDQKHPWGNISSKLAKAVLVLCLSLGLSLFRLYLGLLALEGEMTRYNICWGKVSSSKMFNYTWSIKIVFFQCGVLWTLLVWY